MLISVVTISSFTAAITSALTVTHLKSGVRRPEDLARVCTGAVGNSTSEAYLKGQRIPFCKFNAVTDGLASVASGAIDAFVHDAPILQYQVSQNFRGRVDVLPVRFEPQDYGIGLPAGSPLREPVNRAMLAVMRSADWQECVRRYVGE
jgi:ABC-type amino acid transport substrate-binding protein